MTDKQKNAPKASPTKTEQHELKSAKGEFETAQSALGIVKKTMKRAKGEFEKHVSENAPKKDYRGTYRASMRKFILVRREFRVGGTA